MAELPRMHHPALTTYLIIHPYNPSTGIYLWLYDAVGEGWLRYEHSQHNDEEL